MAKKKETETRDSPDIEAFRKTLDVLLTFPIIQPNEAIIGQITQLLDNVETLVPSILQESVNKVKNAVQIEAANTWNDKGQRGLLTMATGTGKSKIPIDILKEAYKNRLATGNLHLVPGPPKILLIVPTEKLRDENWKDEFTKWDASYIYDNWLTRTCYASLGNYENQEFDLVIGDEFHNITEDKAFFFLRNKIHRFIGLTATPPPVGSPKERILKNLNIPIVYNVPLDIAVRLKLVSPYDVTIVECRLDDITKNIAGGTKAKPFQTTEFKQYNYLSGLVNVSMFSTSELKKALKFRILNRMRFIKNLPSRTKIAKFILQAFITPEERVLIFAGGIEQAEEIWSQSFHSKTNDTFLNQFIRKQISRLSCVAALNEGMNIPDIQTIIIVAIESGEKTLTQQIGRSIRFSIGHRARVIIIVFTDTVDEKWMNSALTNIDPSNIRRVRMANLIAGVETI